MNQAEKIKVKTEITKLNSEIESGKELMKTCSIPKDLISMAEITSVRIESLNFLTELLKSETKIKPN